MNSTSDLPVIFIVVQHLSTVLKGWFVYVRKSALSTITIDRSWAELAGLSTSSGNHRLSAWFQHMRFFGIWAVVSYVSWAQIRYYTTRKLHRFGITFSTCYITTNCVAWSANLAVVFIIPYVINTVVLSPQVCFRRASWQNSQFDLGLRSTACSAGLKESVSSPGRCLAGGYTCIGTRTPKKYMISCVQKMCLGLMCMPFAGLPFSCGVGRHSFLRAGDIKL
jgi:hypothetical protein